MENISIIIPVLNEISHLADTIKAIRTNCLDDCIEEIIVVDGGSTDGSQTMVRQLGAMVIEVQPQRRGRSELLNAGARVARGDILLFLDADSVLPPEFDAEIMATMRLPGCVGGAFEFKLEGPEFGLRLVECINRLRYRIWPWYYGDQGIFVSRKVFETIGGYPAVALMEASDFCRMAARRGALKLVHKDMVTSARRFLERGIYTVLGFDIRMWWRNLWGQDVEQFAQEYWATGKSRRG